MSMQLAPIRDLVHFQVEAERQRLELVLHRPVCGHHDGGTRPDGSPAVCVLDPGHDWFHLAIDG